MLFSLALMTASVLVGTTAASITIPADQTVVSMLGMIPSCSIPCVTEALFQNGGCPMTNAGALAQCACTNVTMQARLSTCVQKSCGFVDQTNVTSFAAGLCEAYPKESRVHELKTISIVTIILSVPFLFTRLYARWLKTRRLWLDDAYAIIAAVFLMSVSAVILRMSLMGFGLHYWNVPAEHGVELLKMYYVCQMLYVLVQCFSKVAILCLYARLFPDFIRWFHWAVRGMTAFMFVHCTVFLFLVIFQCMPISAIWDKTVTGKCVPIAAVIGFTGAGLSIAEDFIILLLPISELWKLQMNTKKKVGLVILLSVGSFASITSIIRLRYVLKYANTYDSTWDNVDVIKWSLIEILSACICGNLLPLRPVAEKFLSPFVTLFTWYSDWSRRSSNHSSKKSSGFGKFSWLDRSRKPAGKPKLISTLNFTQVSLSPRWDEKTNTSELAMVSPAAYAPMDKGFEAHDRDVESRMTPQTTTRETGKSSLDTSPPKSGRTQRKSIEDEESVEERNRAIGNWSHAWSVLDRQA